MQDHSHRRQVWLFLLAIVVPSVALAWIGVRLIVQETELAEGRQLAERRRIVSGTRQALVSRLERIRLQDCDSNGRSCIWIRTPCLDCPLLFDPGNLGWVKVMVRLSSEKKSSNGD